MVLQLQYILVSADITHLPTIFNFFKKLVFVIFPLRRIKSWSDRKESLWWCCNSITLCQQIFNKNWLYVLIISRTRFRVNPHSIIAWMARNSLLEAGAMVECSFMNYVVVGSSPVAVTLTTMFKLSNNLLCTLSCIEKNIKFIEKTYYSCQFWSGSWAQFVFN